MAKELNQPFAKGEINPYNKFFTGITHLNMLVTRDNVFNSSIGNVTFDKGARTNWHKHSGGQILLVTAGEGRYQEKGKEIQILKAGDVVKAKIVSVTTFGAFAQVIPGVDGLIHISQIANQRIDKVSDVLKVGQEVDVKITDIDFEKKRVSLSMRALLQEEEPAQEAPAQEQEAPAQETEE